MQISKDGQKERMKLEDEDHARRKGEEVQEGRLLRKEMLKLQWQMRRAAVVEDLDTSDDSMLDVLAKQLRLMDIWRHMETSKLKSMQIRIMMTMRITRGMSLVLAI